YHLAAAVAHGSPGGITELHQRVRTRFTPPCDPGATQSFGDLTRAMFRYKEIVVDEFDSVHGVLIAKPFDFVDDGSGGLSVPFPFVNRSDCAKPAKIRTAESRVVRNRPAAQARPADVLPDIRAVVGQREEVETLVAMKGLRGNRSEARASF